MSEQRRPKILVIQPDVLCDMHRFGEWLENDGSELEVVRPFEGDEVPQRVDADALVVLGGSMGANDGAEFPWLADVGRLMRSAVADETPTLGICLGAQILADAMGGEVTRGVYGVELGVTSVTWVDDQVEDPLLDGLPTPLLAGSFHFDAISQLPPDAVRLGVGEVYENQVFRVGTAWGVQFHPEISPARFRTWRDEVEDDEGAIAHFDAQADRFEEVDASVQEGTRQLAANFAKIVRSAPDRAR
jgi:GMP synthase (glutamine-hydrolysing)